VRLAAIDVGSNSVHMVVADVAPDGRIAVVDRVKEMLRLGRGAFTTGRLSAEAMELGVRAMQTFARLAKARRVERLRAVATSAVREADNGGAFVHRLRRETGLPVHVISGGEEAELIFRAARHALGLEGGPDLLVDVGGGSVELVLVRDGKPLWLRSLPLGVTRLTERFLAGDPPSGRRIKRLEKHLDRELGTLLATARYGGVRRAVGTSGTVNTLVAMARAARGDDLARLHGASASATEVHRLRRRILALPAARRAELPGIDGKRVDLMPAAAVLIDFVMARASASNLVACGWALREGVLLELAGVGAEHGATTTVRRGSVEAVAARFCGDNAHGRQTARLALALFDATADALDLAPRWRELLEYAALLHDVGHAIDHDRHHRHTAYLVRNSELLGFEPLEVEAIAHVCRSHRKRAPKSTDLELRGLPAGVRRAVCALSALIRVADALDRTRFGAVGELGVSLQSHRLVVTVEALSDDAELDVWAAERRAELLARLLERPIAFRLRRQPAPRVARASR
jgi:exopolyphosphatase/guanosine-5'-triphosphate,3'-diphosphate pyrophosphatase